MARNIYNAEQLTLERAVQMDPFDMVRYEDATYYYVCAAEPGTALNVKEWKVSRLKKDGSEIKQANNANFKNLATDLITVQALFP